MYVSIVTQIVQLENVQQEMIVQDVLNAKVNNYFLIKDLVLMQLHAPQIILV